MSRVFDVFLTAYDVLNIQAAENWLERQKEEPDVANILDIASVSDDIITFTQKFEDYIQYQTSTPLVVSENSPDTLSSENWYNMTPLSTEGSLHGNMFSFSSSAATSNANSRLSSRANSPLEEMGDTDNVEDMDVSNEKDTHSDMTVLDTTMESVLTTDGTHMDTE